MSYVQRIVLLDGQIGLPRSAGRGLVQVEALAQVQELAVVDVVVQAVRAYGYTHVGATAGYCRRLRVVADRSLSNGLHQV